MGSKPRLAYMVVHSSGTYGAITPYAVVSTASGMPHMPAYHSEEEAQQVADRLNAEETQRTTQQHASAAAQRKVDRLQAKASTHDEGWESTTTQRYDRRGEAVKAKASGLLHVPYGGQGWGLSLRVETHLR